MRIVRYGEPGAEMPGVLDNDGNIRDVSAWVDEYAGEALDPDNLARLSSMDPASLPPVEGSPRLGPPVKERAIFGIGLNYAAHAAENNVTPPPEPIVFHKCCPLTGHRDNIVVPKASTHTDWEVELVVVIGRKAQYVSEADALDYVAGYACGNDVSERDWQLNHHGEAVKGKGCETFAPIGPFLMTADELVDPQTLDLWCEVNGTRHQGSNTSDMVFGCAQIIAGLTRMIPLYPGDVIYTGTPSGVGHFMDPPLYLKSGDVVRLGVERLGECENACVDWAG